MRLVVAILLSSLASTAFAGEVTEADVVAWVKQVKGKWTTELTAGEKVFKGTFAMRRVKGTASGISHFSDSDGTTTTNGAEIGGWQSDRKVCQFNGYMSNGDWYQLVFTKLSANGGEGTITGVSDGKPYKNAKFVIKAKDKNHLVWHIDGKTKDGQPLKMSSEMTRATK